MQKPEGTPVGRPMAGKYLYLCSLTLRNGILINIHACLCVCLGEMCADLSISALPPLACVCLLLLINDPFESCFFSLVR